MGIICCICISNNNEKLKYATNVTNAIANYIVIFK